MIRSGLIVGELRSAAVEVPFLLAGGMDLFESVTTAFATAGTGGFFIKTTSLIGYSTYIQVVLTVFMLLFGVNFNVYALLLVRKFSAALMDEELRVYLGTFLLSTGAITLNLVLSMQKTFGGALQDAAFHVSSIMTTTGFVSADFDLWPGFSKVILLLLMVFGACAGSTGGGVKIARVILLFKTAKNYLVKMFRPRLVRHVHLNGKVVEHETTHGVLVFMVFYSIICVVSMLVISLENHSFDTTLSAVFACINNVGPGLGVVGPTSSFAELSCLSKIVLSFDMLFGRLEIYPMLLLFVPAVWKRK